MADCCENCYESDPLFIRKEGKEREGPTTLADRTLQGALEALDEREREVCKLRQQLSEILRINHQWDTEYKELKRLYDTSVKSGISCNEGNELLVVIQNENRVLHEQLKSIKGDKEKVDRKLSELKSKYDHLKIQYSEIVSRFKQRKSPSPPPPDHSTTITKLQEEKMLLTTQVQAYKEDYQAEKRDREKVIRERETERLRYEAEIASLKIQFDRATSELVRYKGEAAILGQQLRLKQQREDEEYRRHLESQGYSARKPLPPLDPFVEKDVRSLYYSHSDPSMTPPLHSPTMPPTRRLSLGYQTHMSETRPQQFQAQRRTSIPSARPVTIDLTTPTYRDTSLVSKKEDLRSVSPQIHRLGNLRLYSRESDPDFESDLTSFNNLDTSYEGGVERRVEADLKPPHISLSSDSSPLETGRKLCDGGERLCQDISNSTPNLST